ncbi:hypothetical protein BGZ67_010763 [Mortierella alpina]|nr:hypothetical protein BGZ67_010763 [Mortierella alpina]
MIDLHLFPFQHDGKKFVVKNESNSEVRIKLSWVETTVTKLGINVDAGVKGAGVGGNVETQSNMVISRFGLKPNESQDVWPKSKSALVSAFALRDGTMWNLYENMPISQSTEWFTDVVGRIWVHSEPTSKGMRFTKTPNARY